LGQNTKALNESWVIRVASKSVDVARSAANQILEADLAQFLMTLTTVVAAVTYAWIEGFALMVPPPGTPEHGATQNLWIFNHFSSYNVAMAILFTCITGSFALLKSRSMFARGNRYFLFAVLANYPLSWLVEDFAFFFFCPFPNCRLTSGMWTNWFLGGVSLMDPWTASVQIWIPSWYFLILVWAIGCHWFAHRCTVYDNLIKDEIGQQILPKLPTLPKLPKLPKLSKSVEQHASPHSNRVPATVPKVQPPQKTQTPVAPTIEDLIKRRDRSIESPPPARSPDAETALIRLRKKWVRNDDKSTAGA
jgi:hypothetical protein